MEEEDKLEREPDFFDQAHEAVMSNDDLQESVAEQNYEEAQEVKQDQAEIDDPRESENWGFKGVVKELQSALTGGVQDSLSSVSIFADLIEGKKFFQRPWTSTIKLNQNKVLKIQSLLVQNGYDVGGLDGLIGIKTRQSLGKYQEKIKQKITCYPN